MDEVDEAAPPPVTFADLGLSEPILQAVADSGYVTLADGRLAGLVTMRDLLFSEKSERLEAVMLRDVFTLRPDMAVSDAMRLTLNRHYPVYPVCDGEGRLLGLVRGDRVLAPQPGVDVLLLGLGVAARGGPGAERAVSGRPGVCKSFETCGGAELEGHRELKGRRSK